MLGTITGMSGNGDGRRAGDGRQVARRDVLAAGATLATGAASGCLQRVRSIVDRPAHDQLALQVKTLPADADEPATRIARSLVDNLTAVGIDAEIQLLREEELRRDVLTNGAFELYVYRMPLGADPDFLRPRLHSVFKGQPGWQNPFGFTDLTVDEQLDAQRSLGGEARRAVVEDVQESLSRLQPFVSLAVPDEICATRDDRFVGWDPGGLVAPGSYLRLSARGDERAEQLRVVGVDDRLTANLNPIAIAFRDRGTVTGLVYEPLGRRLDDEVVPWLASDWTSADDGRTRLRVTLREGLAWHDGEELTASDVAFTYRFLRDTTLGEREAAVPAPRYRGRTSLVEGVEVLDDRVVRLDLGDTTPAVARRALTVPVLPAHVWRERSVEAELAGVEVNDRVTEALVWDNPEPIGSGPLAFARRPSEGTVVFERNPEHFLHRDAVEPPTDALAGGVAFDELAVEVGPSAPAAVQLVADDAADATTPGTTPDVVPQIGQAETLTLRVSRSPWLYHVGFDTGQDPLGNPHVRRTIARLVDKAWIVDEILDGYGRPAATPLAGTGWVPESLAWEGTDPEVPFVGAAGDLDADAARDLFRNSGFEYEDGRLLRR